MPIYINIGGIWGRHGERRVACRILVRKPKGKKLRRKTEHKNEYNINMDLTQIDLEGVDWIDRAQGRDKEGGGGYCECGNELFFKIMVPCIVIRC